MDTTDDTRFAFGRNWARFLQKLDDDRIAIAERSLMDMLAVHDLAGRSFLDVGCGSGLFSLAARRLGATVRSFDYDVDSVGCAQALRERFFPDDPRWVIERGSALDRPYLASLGTFDVVYAWGVLHHTGAMWDALDAVTACVAPAGRLFIAIYNDQGPRSRMWWWIKRVSNALPEPLRAPYAALAMAPFEARLAVKATLDRDPGRWVRSWREYRSARGMSRWHDILDWVGGFPFEVASVEALESFYGQRGLRLDRVERTGSLGCNQLVFTRVG